MTSDGKEIWDSYTRGLPVVKKKSKAAATKAQADKKAARKNAEREPVRPTKITAAEKLTDVALERRREKSLRQGDIDIDARLDLHGMIQVEAFEVLGQFMRRAAKTGKRHLLIITGKGNGKGVLRDNLRGWLEQLPEAARILTVRQAAVRHGGDGAFYVVLRRSQKIEN